MIFKVLKDVGLVKLLLGGLIIYFVYKIFFGMKKFLYSSVVGHQQRWIDYITPFAKKYGLIYGIPYQFIVVQTALENGWGKSSLLTKYNNFGGVKAVKGDNSVAMNTDEFINGVWVLGESHNFAVFKNPLDGFKAYLNFFKVNSRYRYALNYPKDAYQFAIEIKKAGYATDPNYVKKIHDMLNKYF